MAKATAKTKAECLISWTNDDGVQLILNFDNLSLIKAGTFVQADEKRGTLYWEDIRLVPKVLARIIEEHTECRVEEGFNFVLLVPVDPSLGFGVVQSRVKKVLTEVLGISVGAPRVSA